MARESDEMKAHQDSVDYYLRCENCAKNVTSDGCCDDMDCGSDNGFPHFQPRKEGEK